MLNWLKRAYIGEVALCFIVSFFVVVLPAICCFRLHSETQLKTEAEKTKRIELQIKLERLRQSKAVKE